MTVSVLLQTSVFKWYGSSHCFVKWKMSRWVRKHWTAALMWLCFETLVDCLRRKVLTWLYDLDFCCTDLLWYLKCCHSSVEETRMRLCVDSPLLDTATKESDVWLKGVENLVFCVCVNPALLKLLSSAYMDQRLSYYAETLRGEREGKLPVIPFQRTKYQSTSVTNKSGPAFKMLAAPMRAPAREIAWKVLKK